MRTAEALWDEYARERKEVEYAERLAQHYCAPSNTYAAPDDLASALATITIDPLDRSDAIVRATEYGDVDEVRRLLRELNPASSQRNEPPELAPPPPPLQLLAVTPQQLQTAFNLTLNSQAVMGSVALWPAATALCAHLQQAPELYAGASVLELGAGAGAPGLITAMGGASMVVLTDGDAELVPLLGSNHALNRDKLGCPVSTGLLDWRDATHVTTASRSAGAQPGVSSSVCGFDVVLASDVLFGGGDVEPLAHAVARLLRRTARARFVLARSDFFEVLVDATFVAACEVCGLRLLRRLPMGCGAAILEFDFGGAEALFSGLSLD